MPERTGAAVNPSEPVPVFLIETHEAHEKTWIEPLANLDDEVVVVDRVRQRVRQAVELEMKAGAVAIGPTFTRTLPLPEGPVVAGVCVISRPRRISPTVS